jgi:hypothetical protein
MDIGHTLVAKSDQLNADDLVGGDIIVRITGVNAGDGEQPVVIAITGGHKPWKPCKTMRRVLALGWGTDASAWVGRGLKLYRDPDVKWAGSAIGGIRIRAMTDIAKAINVKLAETKGGKKLEHQVAVLTLTDSAGPMSESDFLKWLGHATSKGGWTRDQVRPILVEHGSADPTKIAPEKRAAIVAIVSKAPAPVEDEPGDEPPEGAGVRW